jgi:hypothetical protein
MIHCSGRMRRNLNKDTLLRPYAAELMHGTLSRPYAAELKHEPLLTFTFHPTPLTETGTNQTSAKLLIVLKV